MSDNKLSKLESIRGFAALYVGIGHILIAGQLHATGAISFPFRFGQEAVILFFLLSGFVIRYAYTFSKDKSFKTFFSKRFFRIYIPLILIFITNYLLLVVYNNGLLKVDLKTLFGNLFMLQDASYLKPNVICDTLFRNEPLWSLSYEWWFYMIFFIVVNSPFRKKSLIVYSTSTLATATYLYFPNFFNRELMYLLIWWIGSDLAELHLKKESIKFRNLLLPIVFLSANITLLSINIFIHLKHSTIGVSPFLEFRHFSFTLIALIVIIIWNNLKWVGFRLTFGPFKLIAPISFGFYISHWFLVVDAHYLDTIIGSTFIRTALYLSICLLFSYFIERIAYPKLNLLLTKRK